MKSAERIRILRERDGLSQNDLASKLGLSRSSISMYETGERIPSTYVYQAMADLFNVDLDYIMARSDKTTVLPERLDYENRLTAQSVFLNRAIDVMRRLNAEGQSRVANYAEDLHASGKYDSELKIMSLSPQEVSASNAQIAAHSGEELDDEQRAEILGARDEFQKKQEGNNK